MAEEAVGQAFRDKIAEGAMKREDLFYTSKLWGTFHRPDLVHTTVEKALASVQLDYIDLFIIHHPVSLKPGEDLFPTDENGTALFEHVDLRKTWEAMKQCKDAGLVKSIGVSNFNQQQLKLILNKPGLKYKPVCNQVECHPYLTQNKLLEFCKANDIAITAYGVLGSPTTGQWVDQSCPPILKDATLISIGEKYKKTVAQVSIRYIIQRRCSAVVKSFNPNV
ncbi:unnamed protein product [Staurois parvus]|uniref:NADP-dependent oxidoreductase domain-containing protein n=1 Tax=Staurois parvus TaxID=386267 RepID=A0ABN9DAJ1_9NEOB|nr:unnamed protein product [Staurois parvus]